MYDGLNVGKRNVTLNLKHPDAVALVQAARRRVGRRGGRELRARAMKGFGLDYDTLAGMRPDLVMISACLNGNTGPHKDYPGFGGQGAALSGYNWLTGWPDREPVGPFGTITDSLAPRYVATALAAGLALPPPTGRGVYLDLSQVEVGDVDTLDLAARLPGRRHDRRPRRQPLAACGPPRRVPCAARASSATGGSRSRRGPTTSGRALAD